MMKIRSKSTWNNKVHGPSPSLGLMRATDLLLEVSRFTQAPLKTVTSFDQLLLRTPTNTTVLSLFFYSTTSLIPPESTTPSNSFIHPTNHTNLPSCQTGILLQSSARSVPEAALLTAKRSSVESRPQMEPSQV